MKKSLCVLALLCAFALTGCGTPVSSASSSKSSVASSVVQSSSKVSSSAASSSKASSSVASSSAASSSVASSSVASSSSQSESSSESSVVSSSEALVDPYTVNSVALVQETDKVYFEASGTYKAAAVLNSPVIKITSDPNTTATKETFTGEIIVDATALTFTCKVDVTAMVDTSWHDIKIYLDSSSTEATGEIDKTKLTDAMYAATLDVTTATGKTTYAFQNWDNKLKLYVTITDNKVTSYNNMYMKAETDGVYMHLVGTNTHANAKFVFGPADTPLRTVDVAATGAFDAAIKINDLTTGSDHYGIRFFYDTDAGTQQKDEITSVNLADKLNMPGVSYGGTNYVFTKDTGGDVNYYKVRTNTDGFSVDTAILSTAESKAYINIRGLIDVTKTDFGTLSNVTMKLNGKADDSNGDLATVLGSFAIPAADITADGYINTTLDITDMNSTGAIKDKELGAMQIWNNDTAMLNNFWPGDWTHGNDVTSVVLGSSKYVLGSGQWGKYTLDKVANS